MVKQPFSESYAATSGCVVVDEPNGLPKRKRATNATPSIDSKRAKPDLENTSDKRFQVATKNDDAPVEVRDWDVWLVNNYQHPEHITVNSGGNWRTAFQIKNPAKILVCKPGSYSEEKHGHLFDANHNLLICRARQNAFRGLTAYLQAKHGGQTIEFTVKYHKRITSGSRNRRRKRKRRGNSEGLESEEPVSKFTVPCDT